jgi:hypothetical protein
MDVFNSKWNVVLLLGLIVLVITDAYDHMILYVALGVLVLALVFEEDMKDSAAEKREKRRQHEEDVRRFKRLFRGKK